MDSELKALAYGAACKVRVNPHGARSDQVSAFCQSHELSSDTARRVASLVRMGYGLDSAGVMDGVLKLHKGAVASASGDPLSSTPRRAAAVAAAAAAGDVVQKVLADVVPSARVQELKLALFDVVRQRVAQIAPCARAAVFGSVAAQTDTRGSDIDITVSGDVDDPHSMLKALYVDLSRHVRWEHVGAFERAQFTFVDTARVPTIQATVDVPRAEDPSDTTRQIFFDVSCNQLSGLRHSVWLRLVVIPETPLVSPMLRLVKHWLVERGLPDAKHGGFGSFFWSVLVVRCCRQIAAARRANSAFASVAAIAATCDARAALRATPGAGPGPQLDVAMEIFFKMYAAHGAFASPLPSESGAQASAHAKLLRRPVSDSEFDGVWATWPAVVNPMTHDCVSFRMSTATYLFMRLELVLAAESLVAALRPRPRTAPKASATAAAGSAAVPTAVATRPMLRSASAAPFLVFLQYGQLLLARAAGAAATIAKRFGQVRGACVRCSSVWFGGPRSCLRSRPHTRVRRSPPAGARTPSRPPAATCTITNAHVCCSSAGRAAPQR